jgi:hypothetical protein
MTRWIGRQASWIIPGMFVVGTFLLWLWAVDYA